VLKLRTLLVTFALTAVLGAQQKVGLVGASAPSTPSGHALRLLEETFTRRGIALRRLQTTAARHDDELLLTLATGPEGAAESFSIRKAAGAKPAITVAGGGEVGLAYGIFELLGQVEASPSSFALCRAVSEVERRPEVKVRSMAMSILNRELEKDWFFSKEFWNQHFGLMAKSLLN